jgi:hypothetical protein
MDREVADFAELMKDCATASSFIVESPPTVDFL